MILPNQSSRDRLSKLANWQFRWRGWILSGLFLILFTSRFFTNHTLNPIFLFLVLSGMVYRLVASKYIGDHTNALVLAAETLSHSGPYRVGRHPLYLANMLIAAGFIFFSNSLSLLIEVLLLGIIFLHHLLLIRTEEKYLFKIHGKNFQDYWDGTPMWIGFPRTSKELGSSILRQPNWMQVFIRQGANLFKTLLMLFILWLPEMFR